MDTEVIADHAIATLRGVAKHGDDRERRTAQDLTPPDVTPPDATDAFPSPWCARCSAIVLPLGEEVDQAARNIVVHELRAVLA